MQNWKFKTIVFLLFTTFIIAFPFFTIRYFETYTALNLVVTTFLIPILIFSVFAIPFLYLKKIKSLDKRIVSEKKQFLKDVFSCMLLVIISIFIFSGIAFSSIISINSYFGKQQKIFIEEPIIKYETNTTKYNRKRHYILFKEPKNNLLIHLEVYKKYKAGEIFKKEMLYGSLEILYSKN